MKLYDLISQADLANRILGGYVRAQDHPTLPLRILNYTEKAAYEGVWDDVTRQCRGLIYDLGTFQVVARPFPKFFNYGQDGAPELDLDAPAIVTDKVDGSLGILYPTERPHFAVATRGSFTSEQALHATEIWRSRYSFGFVPSPGLTYLFEIVYPENRIVCDYGDMDDLVFLAAVEINTGLVSHRTPWPGLRVEEHRYRTLAEALAAEPRPGAEGLVVYLPDARQFVKLKQDDYVALHRIMTGTNARNVWEVAAARACQRWIKEPKHWGSFLGMDPARAEEVLALGDAWLDGVPDEFYDWVRETIADCQEKVAELLADATRTVEEASQIDDRRKRFEFVQAHPFQREIMRMVEGRDDAQASLYLRAWREATPAPTAPFARTEDVA